MEPCAICVLNAVRQGVSFQGASQAEIVGSKYGEGRTIHAKVTTMFGTDVCWYHVDVATLQQI